MANGQSGSRIDINQLLGTVLNLKQRREEVEQNAILQDNAQRQAGLFNLLAQARNTADPTQATALARLGAKQGYGSEADLISAFSELTPTPDALNAYDFITGHNVLNGLPTSTPLSTEATDAYRKGTVSRLLGRGVGDQAGQEFTASLLQSFDKNAPAGLKMDLGNVFAVRSASGLTPGGYAIDQATANLPGKTQTRIAEIQGGTQLSAPQEGQLGLGYGQLRVQQQLGLLGAANDEAKLLLARTQAKGAPTFDDVRQLLDQKEKLQSAMAAAGQKGVTDEQLTSYKYTLQGINQMLNMAGIPTEKMTLPANGNADNSDIFQGFWPRVGNGAAAIGSGIGSWLQRK